MDGMPPSERSALRHREPSEARGQAEHPPRPADPQWLTEFMRREGLIDDRRPAGADLPPHEAAEKSYRGRALLAAGVLIAVGLAAVVADERPGIGHHPNHAAPRAATALRLPQSASSPAKPHDAMPEAGQDAALALASSGFPPQPVQPPPALLNHWAGTLSNSKPPIHRAKTTPPDAAFSAPPAPAVPPTPAPPAGTALHVEVLYAPAAAAAGGRIDAFTARLRSENSDIASTAAVAGPASVDGVGYFFPDDRAGASRIAASLARMTKRPEPVVLVHARPLPRPGTVEIRLPLQDEKDMNNEGR